MPKQPKLIDRAANKLGFVRKGSVYDINHLMREFDRETKRRRKADFQYNGKIPPNALIANHLQEWRADSRNEVMGNPLFARAVSIIVQNVIGDGFRLVRNRARSASYLTERRSRMIVDDFQDYLDNAEATGMKAKEMLESIVYSMLVDGEAVVRTTGPMGQGTVHLIDPARVPAQNLPTSIENWQRHVCGILVDGNGKPVSYSVYDYTARQEDYATSVSERVPANQISHLFIKNFPLQLRGIPMFASSTPYWNQMREYQSAVLSRIRTEALLVYALNPNARNAFYDGDEETVEYPKQIPLDDVVGEEAWQKYPLDKQMEFMFNQLQKMQNSEEGVHGVIAPKGHQVDFKAGNANYLDYRNYSEVNTQLTMGGLGVLAQGNFASLSYFAGRQLSLSERRLWSRIQNILVDRFLMPLFLDWLDYELLRSRDFPPGLRRQDLRRVYTFKAHPFESINPREQALAEQLEMQNGTNLVSRLVEEKSGDYEAFVREKLEEEKLEQRLRREILGEQQTPEEQPEGENNEGEGEENVVRLPQRQP